LKLLFQITSIIAHLS